MGSNLKPHGRSIRFFVDAGARPLRRIWGGSSYSHVAVDHGFARIGVRTPTTSQPNTSKGLPNAVCFYVSDPLP